MTLTTRDKIDLAISLAGLIVMVYWVHASLSKQESMLDESRLTHAQIRKDLEN